MLASTALDRCATVGSIIGPSKGTRPHGSSHLAWALRCTRPATSCRRTMQAVGAVAGRQPVALSAQPTICSTLAHAQPAARPHRAGSWGRCWPPAGSAAHPAQTTRWRCGWPPAPQWRPCRARCRPASKVGVGLQGLRVQVDGRAGAAGCTGWWVSRHRGLRAQRPAQEERCSRPGALKPPSTS